MENTILLKNLSKQFLSPLNREESCLAVDGITLEVGEQEFLTMVGPSGCGKSTVLRMIAGLEQPTSGEIYVEGQRIDTLPPQARNVGFMFQGYALFKHMTVAENIGFGLKVKGMPKKERQRRIDELVSLMGLEGLEGRKPTQLSGGQQQRVALARALAPRPRILLLDEPFGALDAKVRQRLRADTKRWQQELKIPTILVTHDQREALELGDRVVIMNAGRFEQIDTSWNIYNYPANPFVARFIGRVNVFSTKVEANSNGLMQNAEFEILVRPEDMSIQPWDNHQSLEAGKILGTIVSYAFLGRTIRLEIQLKNGKLVTVAIPKHQALLNDLHPGRSVILSIGSFQIFPLEPVSLNHSQTGMPVPEQPLRSDPSQKKAPVTWQSP
jgi:ABC-type Fe3+/spermidine/putrescine transport system ATPase subunit